MEEKELITKSKYEKMYGNQIFVYSEKASKHGCLTATLKNGQKVQFTSVFDNEEKMNEGYKWDDKSILAFNSKDIANIFFKNENINKLRKPDKIKMKEKELITKSKYEKMYGNQIFVYSEKASKHGYITATLKNGQKVQFTSVFDNEEKMNKIYKWDDKSILTFNSKDIANIDFKNEAINKLRKTDEIKEKPFKKYKL